MPYCSFTRPRHPASAEGEQDKQMATIDIKSAAPVGVDGPRPLFPMDPVQIIRTYDGRFFVSFNGDAGHGPFRTREAAQAYADREPRAKVAA